MHDTFFMHMHKCTGNLPHKVPNGRFIELQVLGLFFLNKFLEIATFRPLSDNDQFVVMNEGIDISYDM